jgi:hypothetical protein
LKSFCPRKDTWGYAKEVKEKEKIEKMGIEVFDIENNGYLDAHLKKYKER